MGYVNVNEVDFMQNEIVKQELNAVSIRIENIRCEYKAQAKAIVKLIRSQEGLAKKLYPKVLDYLNLYEAGLIPTEYFIFQVFQILYAPK
jgi:hypothetical protein